MNNLSWKWLAVLALVFVITGCGDGGPRLYKAGGKVMYKSAPVDNATVTFAYEDGNFANAVTGTDGSFLLAYMGKPGGAALGKCKVSITKNAAIAVNASAAATASTPVKSAEEYKQREEEKKKAFMKFAADKDAETSQGGPKSLIPKKYADANTSALQYEITTDETKNNWTIELVD